MRCCKPFTTCGHALAKFPFCGLGIHNMHQVWKLDVAIQSSLRPVTHDSILHAIRSWLYLVLLIYSIHPSHSVPSEAITQKTNSESLPSDSSHQGCQRSQKSWFQTEIMNSAILVMPLGLSCWHVLFCLIRLMWPDYVYHQFAWQPYWTFPLS